MPVAVVRQLSPASPATQDYTSSGLGTVVAIPLAIATYGTVDGTVVDHAGMSIGMSDITSQSAHSGRDQHGVSITNCARGVDVDSLVGLFSTSTAALELIGNYSSLVTDGVRLDWTTTTRQALTTLMLLGGSGISVAHGTITSLPDDAVTHEEVIGFDADIIFFAYSASSVAVQTQDLQLSFGAATAAANQRCTIRWSDTSDEFGDIGCVVFNNRICGYFNQTSTPWTAELTALGATSFTLTGRGTPPTGYLSYTAIKLDGGQAWVGSIATPTSPTSTFDVTGPNFEPDGFGMVLSACATENTLEFDDDAGPFGISISDGTTSICNSISADDAAATSDTQSLSDDKIVNLDSATGAALFDATLTGTIATGWRMDLTATDGTARRWWGWAIKLPEDEESSSSSSSSSSVAFSSSSSSSVGTSSSLSVFSTTVYSDASDGSIECRSTVNYTTARDGSGTLAQHAASNILAGQQFFSSSFYAMEGFLNFDVSALSGDDVTDATLSLWLVSDQSDTDFTLQVRSRNWGDTLETADFVPGADLSALTLLATLNSSGIGATGAYKALTSDPSLLTAIETAAAGDGILRLILCSDRTVAGTEPTNNEYLHFSSADVTGTTQDPKLVIEHTTSEPVSSSSSPSSSSSSSLSSVGTSSSSSSSPSSVGTSSSSSVGTSSSSSPSSLEFSSSSSSPSSSLSSMSEFSSSSLSSSSSESSSSPSSESSSSSSPSSESSISSASSTSPSSTSTSASSASSTSLSSESSLSSSSSSISSASSQSSMSSSPSSSMSSESSSSIIKYGTAERIQFIIP